MNAPLTPQNLVSAVNTVALAHYEVRDFKYGEVYLVNAALANQYPLAYLEIVGANFATKMRQGLRTAKVGLWVFEQKQETADDPRQQVLGIDRCDHILNELIALLHGLVKNINWVMGEEYVTESFIYEFNDNLVCARTELEFTGPLALPCSGYAPPGDLAFIPCLPEAI